MNFAFAPLSLSLSLNMPLDEEFSLLELFSGIGGFRVAVDLARKRRNTSPISKVVAVDMSTACNSVYKEIFSPDIPLESNICTLPLSWFESAVKAPYILTMSPPCQPHTRQGNKKDIEDPRSSALLHICEIFKDLKNLPDEIYLENVDGFKTSQSFEILKEVLQSRGYVVQGFLLNPLQFGYPNSRSRFYMKAKLLKAESASEAIDDSFMKETYPEREVFEFLDSESNDELTVPDSVLAKPSSFALDIVSPESVQTMCFTRGYGRLVNGSGSVLLFTAGQKEFPGVRLDEKKRPIFNLMSHEMIQLSGKLRYFSPTEILRLQGFEETDKFAEYCRFLSSISAKSAYRMLGNSLNPDVVALVINS
jgi:tRNA (cytosine38-C5)-methyltransferase